MGACPAWHTSMNVLISEAQIEQRVTELAKEMQGRFKDDTLTVVGVLTGSLIFVADLVRRMTLPMEIGFLSASSYRGEATSPGELLIDTGLLPDIKGKTVLVVDDILDTGHTLKNVLANLQEMGAKQVISVVLLRKIGRQEISLEPDFCGFTIPDKFVVGYGLDYNDKYRNLPYIADLT